MSRWGRGAKARQAGAAQRMIEQIAVLAENENQTLVAGFVGGEPCGERLGRDQFGVGGQQDDAAIAGEFRPLSFVVKWRQQAREIAGLMPDASQCLRGDGDAAGFETIQQTPPACRQVGARVDQGDRGQRQASRRRQNLDHLTQAI
jgi:hypothetical protein